MRIVRFFKRFKAKYPNWKRQFTLFECLKYAWIQSKKHPHFSRDDYEVDTRGIDKEADELFDKIFFEKELKKDIGDELFDKLTKEDKDFIIKTEGSVDLGKKFNQDDLNKIMKDL